MKKIINERFLAILIVLLMISLPLLEFIGLPYRRRFFCQQESLVIIGILLCIVLLLYYFVNIFKKNKSKQIVLSDIFIILSIIFSIISIIFSKDIKKSLTGEFTYCETPLQVLTYFTLFFACTLISKTENRKTIYEIFIFLAIIESIIAFLQNFSLWPLPSLFDPHWHVNDHLAFGLTEHCNFFAAISTIFTAICSTTFIYSNKLKKTICFLSLSVLTCFSTLFTYTRIAWVGLFSIIFGLLLLIISTYIFKKDKIIFKKHFSKLSILIICFVICFTILQILYGTILKEIEISKSEISTSTSTSTTSQHVNLERFGSSRGLIWKVGLSALQKFPIVGVGFDNYRYSFEIYNKDLGWSQNKGHNEYIHTLVTQGIPSGITYLAFAFYCCFFPFKKILTEDSDFAKSDLSKIFLIALFAYFVQALFNSSITNVAPYKWILMGLLLPRAEQKNLFEIKFSKRKK